MFGVDDVVHRLEDVIHLLSSIEGVLNVRQNLLGFFLWTPFGQVWTWLTSSIVTTADLSTGSPRPFTGMTAIHRYEPLVQAVADAGLVAVGTWSGYRLMWTQSYRSHYSAHIVFPRLLLAAVLINFAVPLVQIGVDLNNALCDTVLAAQGKDWFVGVLRDVSGTANDLGSGPGLAVLTTLALLGGYLLLALAYYVRYALLVVLVVTAPLAALAFVLPETHRYSREWGSLFASTLLMQPMQLLVLAIAFALEQQGELPIRHLYALCALWIVFKVPGALHAAGSLGTHATTSAKGHAEKLVKTLAAKGVA